ncbi:hypothetical protein NL676_004983 [Syzygium grande]|nr:hypothetical protein NL676_004983 [Syzygium grande]
MDESKQIEEEPEDGHADPEPMNSKDDLELMEQDLELEVAPEEDGSDEGNKARSSQERRYSDDKALECALPLKSLP